MRKAEIKVGGHYLAKVAGKVTTVRVDAIREATGFNRDTTVYDVTNLTTGRKTTFRSAAKFRAEVSQKVCPQCKQPVPTTEVYPFGMHRECYLRSNAVKLQPKPHTTGLSVGPLGGLTTDPTTEAEQGSDPTVVPSAEVLPVGERVTVKTSGVSNDVPPDASTEGEQRPDPTTTGASVPLANNVGSKLGGNGIAVTRGIGCREQSFKVYTGK